MKRFYGICGKRPPLSFVILIAVGAMAGAFAVRAVDRPMPPPGAEPAAAPANEPAAAADRIVLPPEMQREAGIATVFVTSRAAAETVRANGQFAMNEDRTWHVGTLTEGKVEKLVAKVGDEVKAGQVLAWLHSHAVHETRGAYRTALAELDRTRAALEFAKRVNARSGRLLTLQAISQEQADQTATDLKVAQTAVRKAEAAVEMERTHLSEVLEVPADDKPGVNDTDLVPLKAPADGLVVRRLVSEGTVISPGTEAFTITDTRTLWLLAAVNESDLPFVRPGMPARITVRAYAEAVFAGSVLQLGEELDPTTRTLKVRVAVPNPRGLLKPEMFAAVELERAPGHTAVFIPESAGQDIQGQRAVFVQTGSQEFEVRPVRVAALTNGELQIAEGLRDGERVVTAGSFTLKSELLRASLKGN